MSGFSMARVDHAHRTAPPVKKTRLYLETHGDVAVGLR